MDLNQLKEQILKGDRRSISKAITLVESLKSEHIAMAENLLTSLMPYTGNSIRIGISGIPGVGKSSFIENFGNLIIEKGEKVAVLAIDPTSMMSGGSILGDKTRMETLSANENSFIRPSPSQLQLGGVARRTREISLILEAGGYQNIIIETVGVGQSETVVSSMVDIFLVLQMPKTGDELQGIKKGILEVADIILVNKADGDLKFYAEQTKSQLTNAFQYLVRMNKKPIPILLTSNIDISCYENVWLEVIDYITQVKQTGNFLLKRQNQIETWFLSELSNSIINIFESNTKLKEKLEFYKNEIKTNKIPASIGVKKLLSHLMTLD